MGNTLLRKLQADSSFNRTPHRNCSPSPMIECFKLNSIYDPKNFHPSVKHSSNIIGLFITALLMVGGVIAIVWAVNPDVFTNVSANKPPLIVFVSAILFGLCLLGFVYSGWSEEEKTKQRVEYSNNFINGTLKPALRFDSRFNQLHDSVFQNLVLYNRATWMQPVAGSMMFIHYVAKIEGNTLLIGYQTENHNQRTAIIYPH